MKVYWMEILCKACDNLGGVYNYTEGGYLFKQNGFVVYKNTSHSNGELEIFKDMEELKRTFAGSPEKFKKWVQLTFLFKE